MKKIFVLIWIFEMCVYIDLAAQVDYSQYVDPFIGTAGHGHTFPGVSAPFGMIQVSPDTDLWGWDWCSGYHYSDSSLIGFSHRHLSGTGATDLGEIMLLPLSGKPNVKKWQENDWWHGDKKNPDSGYRSRFSHQNESASPGYYQAYLEDYQVNVELTASERVGLHRYSFPKDQENHVLLDLRHQIQHKYGTPIWAHAQVKDKRTLVGYKHSTGWAKDKYVYFVIQFSRPFQNYIFYEDQVNHPSLSAQAENLKWIASFDQDAEPLLVKVALSPVSIENALENLEAEIPHWDFEKVRKENQESWNKELSKVEIQASEEVKRTFYTGLYHAFLAPNLFQDVDGSYIGADLQVHQAQGFTNYTTFSLWDTYRALHPLFTILQTERSVDMINAMLKHYEQSAQKLLPIWPLMANETWTMIGNHAIPVIADAYLKDIPGIDYEKALDYMIQSANRDVDRFADSRKNRYMSYYAEYGYLPIDLEKEAASKTLEYTFDDWCIAQMAKKMGREDIYKEYSKRSGFYKNIYDPQTGFMRAKKSDGKFREPFDPFYAQYGSDFTEGNAWQYTWHVPQDVYGLIDIMGGKNAFSNKLDQLFALERALPEDAPHDVTGLIGQYAHGNEPSHHVAYLYNYAGQPWKSQARVREIMQEFYTDKPDGLCGNEDCGQMSAWYIFSALGFYPVNASNSVYVMASPLIEEAIIHLPKAKRFKIEVKNQGTNKHYIQSVKLNGKKYNKSYLTHQDIMQGGELFIELGTKPNTKWGIGEGNTPPDKAFE